MADIDALFDEYLGATPPVNPNVNLGYMDAAATDVGLNQGPVTEEELLNADNEAAIARSVGRENYRADASRIRTPGETIQDSVVDTVNGALQGALGITALGAGAVDADAGTAVSGFANDVGEFSAGLQTDSLNARRAALGARGAVTDAHNENLRQQELSEGSSEFMANIRKVGRDFISGVTNQDGVTLTSGTANGVGSLLLGGAIGKGVKAAGGWAAARNAVGMTGPAKAGFVINQATGKIAMPAAIGALEGGGAYTQTVNEVMGMSHEDLLAGSPDYVELLNSGYDPEDAKAELANGAGLMAASIQAPVGMATGAIVSKFEGAPFAVPNVKTAVGNILREGVEEGIQSGSGQFSSNLAIRESADQDRELLEGVGGAAGEGALYGMGTAGALQGPTLAVKTPIDTAKWAGSKAWAGVKAASAPLIAYGTKLDEQFRGTPSVPVDELTQAGDEITQSITPEAQTAVTEAAVARAKTPEEQAEVSEYLEGFFKAARFDAEAEGAAQSSPVMAKAIGDSLSRFGAMSRVSRIVTDPQASLDDRTAAATWLVEKIQQNQNLLYRDLPKAIEMVEEGDEDLKLLRQYEDVVANFDQHPELKAALVKAHKVMSSQKLDESNPASVETAAKIAELAPEASNLDNINVVLKHASEGKIQLSPESQKAIEETKLMLETAQQLAAEVERPAKILGKKTPNAVSNEILRDQHDGESREKSGAAHFAGVYEALRNGNRKLATERLEDFMKFAQHMSNKVAAINAHLKGGTGNKDAAVRYQSLSKDRKWLLSERGMWVNPKAAKTVAMAKLVESEARAIASLANRLATINSDLGVKPIAEVRLDAALDGSIEEVLQRHRDGGTEAAQPDTKADTAPDAKPEPAAKPAKDEAPADEAKVEPEVRAVEPDTKPDIDDLYEAQVESANDGPSEAEIAAEVAREKAEAEPVKAEAQPEPKTEAKAEAEKVEEKSEAVETVEEKVEPEAEKVQLYSNEKSGIVNWFKKAFRKTKAPISRVADAELPMADVREALQSHKAAESYVGGTLGNTLKPEASKAFNKLFGLSAPAYKHMKAMLVDLLAQKWDGKTFAELLTEGGGKSPVNTLRRARVLNLVRQTETGFEYDETMLQAALLASLNWLVTSGQQGRSYDDESIARILGVDEGSAQVIAARDFFNNNIYMVDGVKAIASAITRYWGVQAGRNQPVGYTQGIAEAIAKDLLISLETAGLLKVVEHKVGEKDDSKTYLGIKTEVPLEIVQGVKGFPDAIEKLVAIEPEEVNHIGSPPKHQPTHQLGSSIVKLSKQQIQAAKNESETPHKLNGNMFNLVIKGLGRDLAVKLFGFGDTDSDHLNVNHKNSMKGFNRSIEGAFDYVDALAAEMAGKGEDSVYYGYEFSAVNRMHAQGRYNPQSNKLVRELVMSTNATVDLNGEHFGVFMLAVAQHWGEKVHKIGRKASIEAVTKAAKEKYPDSITLLREFVRSKKPMQFNESDVATLQREFGAKMSPGALHAALDYARYLEADQAARSKFETSLYVEADGVTDGPVNALIHLATGPFTPHWIRMVAKGGLFFGSRFKTLADYVAVDKVDLYEQATKYTFKALLQSRLNHDKDNPKVAQQRRSMLFVMSKLLPDVTFNPEADLEDISKSLDLARGIAKNPMTVTVYGSGTKGIANKIVHALTTAYYEQLSAGQVDPLLRNLMNKLTTSWVGNSKDTGKMYVGKVPFDVKLPKDSSPEGYTFTNSQLEVLQRNVLKLFVEPLDVGINGVIDDVQLGKNAVRDAVQVQSLVLQHAFREGIQKKLAEKAKDPEWTGTHNFLSQEELDAIQAEVVTKYHGLIRTGYQSFYPAGSENADVSDPASDDLAEGSTEKKNAKRSIEIARSSSDKLSSPLMVSGPASAGVRGIPYIVIGAGDGQMVQNIATAAGRPEGALYVFDGVNLKLTTAEADSQVINEAVYDGWVIGNPIQAVADSFSLFAEAFDDKDLLEMSATTFNDLARSLGLDEDAHMVSEGIKRLADELQELAMQSQARKNAMDRVNLSVDHMATAESPYVVSDQLELGASAEQQAEQLNALYEEELAKLKGEKPVILKQRVERQDDGTSEAQTYPVEDLTRILPNLGVSANQMALLKDSLKVAQSAGFRLVIGTTEQVADHLLQETGEVTDMNEVHGLASMANRVIYLVDPTAETVVHELLHAATYAFVHDFYNNGAENLNHIEADAVARIEALMTEFLDLKVEGEAHRNVVRDIRSYLAEDNKAGAVNEFMAWVLTNTDLRQKTSKVTVRSELAKIALKVLEALKSLLWGSKAPLVADDLLSNLEFNTKILLQAQNESVQADIAAQLFHRPVANHRLADLRQGFHTMMANLIAQAPAADRLDVDMDVRDAIDQAIEVADSFRVHGFPMADEEYQTFKAIVAALATSAKMDTNALSRVQQLYSHVTKVLKVEDFMASTEQDSEHVRDADRYYAQEKFNSVMGRNLDQRDKQHRSSLMPAFLALAMTNGEFQTVLEQIGLPKSELADGNDLDTVLTNGATKALDAFAKYISGEGNQSDVQGALDALTDRLIKTSVDDENALQAGITRIGEGIDVGNDFVVNTMQKWSGQSADWFEAKAAAAQTVGAKKLFEVGQLFASMINNDRATVLRDGWMSFLNKSKVAKPLHDLMNEIVGRTDSNASIYDMIKLVRSYVQQTRQQWREHLPEQIEKQFSRKLEEAEWTAMTVGLAKTDLAALSDGYSLARILQLATDTSQIATEIERLEGELQGDHQALWLAKAEQLAEYMSTGKAPANLLRNAYAIAHLYGELPVAVRNRTVNPTPQQVKAIDQLVTLYALQKLDESTQHTLGALIRDEAEGVEFVMSSLIGRRRDEETKIDASDRSMINAFKGHVPLEGEAGAQLVVMPDADEQRMKTMGFTKLDRYASSAAERGAEAKSYYYAPVSSKAPYSQGILQNVRQTAGGVDPRSGFSVGIPRAGQVDDPQEVSRLKRAMRLNGANGTQALLPIYDVDGDIVAFERSMDPVQVERLKHNTHMGEVLGIWTGRQIEEHAAQQFNAQLIIRLRDKWEEEKATKAGEYVNLFSREAMRDPIYRDAISLMTPEARRMVRGQFEDNEFWVRKDMINDAIGYRSASVGDLWTGNSRLPPETQKVARAIATAVFKQDAYKKLVQFEKVYQTFITDARVTIVVKSVVVPTANVISNVYHLASRGVPLQHIMKGFPKKTAEVDAFIKGRLRRIELEGLLLAAEGRNDTRAETKIKAELQSIRDANRRMSIWPLIKAGEFASISDAAISYDEIQLSEGRLSAYMEKLTSKLPKELQTVGRYAMVGRDTALFKGMQRAVEYGDFLAKAVLYDDLVIRQKKSPEYALARITEEFINYDRLPGRARGYLENMGLMWFWHFKLRAIKIAMATVRNNPLHLLLAHLAPMPDMGVGTVVTDNALSIVAENKQGWSLGIGQALHAHSLNPWVNLWL